MSTDITTEFSNIVGLPENDQIEYKAVLPPSRTIAQLLASFANAKGGFLILGVSEMPHGIEVKGLSEDFQAIPITRRAIELLSPIPQVEFQYFIHGQKKLFGIKVHKSDVIITLEQKIYKRINANIVLQNPSEVKFEKNGYAKIRLFSETLNRSNEKGTNSKHKLIDHYLNILKIIDDMRMKLFPESPLIPTIIPEGKILARIIFSSFVDNFESYLSDLLYEIYLARPETLRSRQQVTIEEVLNCSDITDFVKYWAKQKLYKLQRGSVKGFIKETSQISDLNVIDEEIQNEIESILQIRHLYSHRNGIVDEKFISYFPNSIPNSDYELTIEEICEKLMYLANIAELLDKQAIQKYDLAII